MNISDEFKTLAGSTTKPELLQQIQNILTTMYPNISKNIITNIMIEKIAQMLTAKWITLENASGEIIPNWYALVILKSGGGKDRLVNDIDKFVMKDFINYYQTMSQRIYQAEIEGNNNISDIVNAIDRELTQNAGGNHGNTTNHNAF